MNYQTPPKAITEWTPLSDFDEYEAEARGWSPQLILDAIREIQRRELQPTKRAHTAQDNRRGVLIRVRLTENERKLIQDLTTTDERRQALMRLAERKGK